MSRLWLVLVSLITVAESGLPRNCTLPSKPFYTCGKRGALQNPEPFGSPFIVHSFDTCRDIAQTTFADYSFVDYGVNFSFDRSSSTCTLYRAGIREQGFAEDPESTVEFYNRHCFHCKRICPPKEGTNLLFNPGFDLQANSITPWLLREGIIASQGANGSRHAIATPAARGDYENIGAFQKFYACTKRFYKVSFDYMTEGSGTTQYKYSLSYSVFNTQDDWFTQVYGTDGEWVHFEDIFYIVSDEFPGPGQVQLYLNMFSLGNPQSPRALIDNVRVEVLREVSMVPDPQAPNLIVNGGFETGALAPWEPAAVPEGSGRLEVVSPGIRSRHALIAEKGKDGFYLFLAQSVTTEPFSTYIFAFDFALVGLQSNPEPTGALSVQFDGEFPGLGGEHTVDYDRLFTKSGRHHIELPMISRDQRLRVRLNLVVREGSRLVFDNISLRKAIG